MSKITMRVSSPPEYSISVKRKAMQGRSGTSGEDRDLWLWEPRLDLDKSDFSENNTCLSFIDKFLTTMMMMMMMMMSPNSSVQVLRIRSKSLKSFTLERADPDCVEHNLETVLMDTPSLEYLHS
ncbi:hypothetical protein DY000_02000804 [Brassica cretica]|uniref:Uncharacterized protein n=1 Tax=Brassica cretica TaxID=69181 RepID=A0ABQ7C4A3_BRACR|nr:hypothetical protein DY000_02000804 [Brassica cretica]